MVNINILSKKSVGEILSQELLKVENRWSKEFSRLRQRINELEDKINRIDKPLKLVKKNIL